MENQEPNPPISNSELERLKRAAASREIVSAQDVHFSAGQLSQILEASFHVIRDSRRSATLMEVDFRGCSFEAPDFGDFAVERKASFLRCRFFAEAPYGHGQKGVAANFNTAHFLGAADFTGARFFGDAEFSSAQFIQAVSFGSSRFEGAGRFGGSHFHQEARFKFARFHGKADFSGSEFKMPANFRVSKFGRFANFHMASFAGPTTFSSATFAAEVDFIGASFGDYLSVGGSEIGGRVRFGGSVSFANATFGSGVSLIAEFHDSAGSSEFSNARFPPGTQLAIRNAGHVDFSGAEISGGSSISVFHSSKRVDGPDWDSDFSRVQFVGPVRVTVSGAATAGRRASASFDYAYVGEDLSITALNADVSLREVVTRSKCVIRGSNGGVSSLHGTAVGEFTFESVDFSDCRLSDAYGLGSAEFAGESVFEILRTGLRGSRRRIREERELPSQLASENRPDAIRAESTYRSLRHAFEKSSNSPGANDFYFGEMLCRKRVARVDRELGSLLLLGVYQRLSGFSTRPARALAFSFLAFMIASLFVSNDDAELDGIFANVFGPIATLEQSIRERIDQVPYLELLVPSCGSELGYALASLALILMLPQLFFALRAQVKR